MRVLADEGISISPIHTVTECQKIVFGIDDRTIVERIKERCETAVRPTQPS